MRKQTSFFLALWLKALASVVKGLWTFWRVSTACRELTLLFCYSFESRGNPTAWGCKPSSGKRKEGMEQKGKKIVTKGTAGCVLPLLILILYIIWFTVVSASLLPGVWLWRGLVVSFAFPREKKAGKGRLTAATGSWQLGAWFALHVCWEKQHSAQASKWELA